MVLRKSTRNIFYLWLLSLNIPNYWKNHPIIWNIPTPARWSQFIFVLEYFRYVLKASTVWFYFEVFQKVLEYLAFFLIPAMCFFSGPCISIDDSLKNQVLPPDTVDFDGSSLACRPFKTWQFFTVCNILNSAIKASRQSGFWTTTTTEQAGDIMGNNSNPWDIAGVRSPTIIYYLFTYLLIYIFIQCIYIYISIYIHMYIFI